jgi:hypothetical protein
LPTQVGTSTLLAQRQVNQRIHKALTSRFALVWREKTQKNERCGDFETGSQSRKQPFYYFLLFSFYIIFFEIEIAHGQ